MPIKVTCAACGKTLNARDDYAGRKTKCPGCGEPITIPEPIYDAEQADDDIYDPDSVEDYEADEYEDDQYDEPDDRRPCRACGEMIKRRAAKCRYCGEIFDRSIGSRGRGRRRGRADPETIRKFRREMYGLGGFWIFIGGCVALLGIALLAATADPGNRLAGALGQAGGAILMILGLVGVGLGICTCLKMMWAVWTGLVLSYLSLLGYLTFLPGNLCNIVILIAVIVQAHRCIGRARELNNAGVPLTSTR